MPTLEEFNRRNGINQDDENVIVSPNISAKSSVEENAAKAGYKGIPQPSGERRRVDLVNDLGLKSELQLREEKAFAEDDITRALGSQLEAAAERKKNEMEAFNEALDQCGGEMSEEDLNMITEQTDYESMLLNPPDPLNSEIKKYNQQQIERFKETASEEELRAMGFVNEKENNSITAKNILPMQQRPNNSVADEQKRMKEDDEDENIINECDDECIVPVIPSNLKEVLNKLPASNEKDDDIIPVVEDTVGNAEEQYEIPKQKDNTKEDDDKIKFDSIPKVPKFNDSLSEIDIDKEIEDLDVNEDFIEEERKAKRKERIKKAGEDVKQKVIPIANRMDIRGFAISTNPVSINNSVEMAKAAYTPYSARWALFSSKRPIVMSGMLGTEIDDLIRLTQDRDENYTVSDIYKRYGLFYNHTLSPKPDTVEDWLKTISIMDIKHLYGAQYKASFEKTNFIPIDCDNPNCNNGFITDNLPFESIVKYENAEAKAKAMEIYNSEPSAESYHLYHSEVVPISDIYAMSFREPSIYDVQVAPKYLERDWADRMEDAIAMNMYIDKIFVIDPTNECLRPLAIKEFPNDPRKTLKAKILALAKVLSTLNSDQYSLISSYIENINKTSNFVNYQMPEVVCPECGTKIEAEPTSAINLLFTRHRLTTLVTG